MATCRSSFEFDMRELAHVTTYMPDSHAWRAVVELFVQTPDGPRVVAHAVARNPNERPRFRALTTDQEGRRVPT